MQEKNPSNKTTNGGEEESKDGKAKNGDEKEIRKSFKIKQAKINFKDTTRKAKRKPPIKGKTTTKAKRKTKNKLLE